MYIQLKLFASLGKYLPPEGERNVARVEVPDGATPHQVMDLFGIPRAEAHLVVVNGVFVPRQRRDEATLANGDNLALWPPVAGG